MPSEINLASTNSDGFIGRLFSAPTIFYGKPLALGRNHASWFLVFAHPYGAQMIRTAMCVNFLVPNDVRCVSAGPADSSPGSGAASVRPRFVVGGTQGLEALNTLSALRDKVGRKPVAVVQTFEDAERDPMGVQAIVEVLVPEDELIRACARCGRWEAEARPRFRRCGGCKSRYYCSRECQKEDWVPDFHKGECDLLKGGQAREVECKRRLHDNGWWFNHGWLGPANLTGIDERKRAEDEGDAEALVYGRRIRPRDVYVSSTLDDALLSQGDVAAELACQIPRIPDAAADGIINIPETGTDWAAEDLLSRLARTPLTFSDIPELPSLPHVAGFTPTGDPLVDEKLFARRLQSTLGTAERQELMRLLTFRANVRYARQEVAYDRWIEEQEGAQGRRSGAKENPEATRVDSDCESVGSMPSAPTVSDSSDYDSEDIFGHGSEE